MLQAIRHIFAAQSLTLPISRYVASVNQASVDKTLRYYENHRSVEWARITGSLSCPLSLNILTKFLYHGLNNRNNGKTGFQNLSLFSSAIAEKLPTKKSGVKSPPFPIYVLYNLHSQVFSESIFTIIQPSICAQFCQYLLRI